MFLTPRDLNLEPRVYGFHLLTGVRMRTYIWFQCVVCPLGFCFTYVLVDILDLVIVLFQTCAVRVVDATRICFALGSRLRYRVVSEWCFRTDIIWQPRSFRYTCSFWLMF